MFFLNPIPEDLKDVLQFGPYKGSAEMLTEATRELHHRLKDNEDEVIAETLSELLKYAETLEQAVRDDRIKS